MFGFLSFDEEIAVRHQNGILNYREFNQLLVLLGDRLAETGLQPGDRVAFVLPNSLESLACYYACILNGWVAVPISERLTQLETRRSFAIRSPGASSPPARAGQLEAEESMSSEQGETAEVSLSTGCTLGWTPPGRSTHASASRLPPRPPSHPLLYEWVHGAPKGSPLLTPNPR